MIYNIVHQCVSGWACVLLTAVVHSDNLRHSEVSVWGLKLTLCFCFLSLRLTKGFLGTRDYQEGHRQTRVIWSPKCHVRHSASGWSNRRALEWRLCPSVAPTWDREDGLVSLEAVIGQGQHGEVGGESSGTFFLCVLLALDFIFGFFFFFFYNWKIIALHYGLASAIQQCESATSTHMVPSLLNLTSHPIPPL